MKTYSVYINGELKRFRLKRALNEAILKAKRAGKMAWSAQHVDAHGRLKPTLQVSKKVRAEYRKMHPHVRSECLACQKQVGFKEGLTFSKKISAATSEALKPVPPCKRTGFHWYEGHRRPCKWCGELRLEELFSPTEVKVLRTYDP